MDTIKLIAPITIANNTYDILTLRRPKVKDRLVVERMKKTDAEKEITMIANLAEVTTDVIEELDLADYAKVQEVLQNFLEPSQTTSD